MTKSTNQRCNAFQSLVGIFLQATVTPEAVREFLAAIGISISTSAINNAVTNLAKNSEIKMKQQGKTLHTLFAYDNLDIDLKQSVPTIEGAQDTLVHLTTGTMLPLHPAVSAADLDCSKHLWSTYNQGQPFNVPMTKIMKLYERLKDGNGLRPRDRFQQWKIIHDLLHYGPESLRKYISKLGNPETYEAIPMNKTEQIPNRTMDIAPSTPAQNAQAIDAILAQAGISDGGQPGTTPIGNTVTLISGDLLTGERIRSLLNSRSVEETPWQRMQFVVYVMGLFHLKMACADAIWRIFINTKGAKDDETCLLELYRQIRPRETGKMSGKPCFRRVHEAVEHIGIVSRLDCLRVAVAEKDPACTSLEAFAEKEPTWEEVVELAERVRQTNVAPADMESNMRQAADGTRDTQHENGLIQQQYFLLYEELTYAMNHGDIGRVEACFLPWMSIFAGCGKHKYAAELRRYLEDVHFRFPEGLK